MTLIEQFPDVSMLIREQKKLDLNYNATVLFKDIQYNPISAEQKRYKKVSNESQFRILVYLGGLFATLLFIAANARAILNWVSSL